MAKDLPKGARFKSLMNADIVIDKKLGEGGQGYVYRILYSGKPMALKIYKPSSLKDPKAFYENLKNNVKNASPSRHFLWPRDILPWNGATFGYVMDLRPPEYHELVDFMNGYKKDVCFQSYRAAVTAAMEMCSAFRILHSRGYSYQDLSDGNFFINPATGSVLICDNDNVSEYGRNTGILGTPEYMAPEIVRGEATPSTATDRFSLAVIIFILITMTHPLEGSRFLAEALTPKVEKIIYGTEPIFILDPADTRNRPVEGIHRNIGMIWPELPGYMKEMFIAQFSRDVMMHPEKRATENQWQQILARFRGDIIYCPRHGAESFGYDQAGPVCSCCKKPLSIPGELKASGAQYPIPMTAGTIVYRCQLGTVNVDKAGDPAFYIAAHPSDPARLVIQNVSGEEGVFYRPGTPRGSIKPGKAAAATPGTAIEISDGRIEVV